MEVKVFSIGSKVVLEGKALEPTPKLHELTDIHLVYLEPMLL